MYLRENPVLQRELLVNLRTPRAFVLLALYQVLLAAVVYLGWPADERLDLTSNPPSAKRLVDLFFLGQYVIASLIAPSFAAGAITGEKERMTYEMLLASPLRPGAIVVGKMVAALTHLGMLVIASMPIIVLCLPLGGVSVYEVLAAYAGLIVSVVLFGAIGVFCSSYFSRTSSSLAVSYLFILPLVILAVITWTSLGDDGEFRLKVTTLVVPAFALTAVILMGAAAAGRMLYPPDFGSEGREVIDLEAENRQAVGLVIQPDQFPDRLFAPPKKQELMADGRNPVYDKEIHSEVFSQGTLMLRIVIQISMLLAIPLMGIFLFWNLENCAWFIVYVIVFNMLIGPVFLAGTMTGERERQTLDLLLTTPLTPWQVILGKFIAKFRISAVLTSFLLWPLLLATVLNDAFWSNWFSVVVMVLIVAIVCVANAVIGMTASLYCRRTSVALLVTYCVLLGLYVAPSTMQSLTAILEMSSSAREFASFAGVTSPFSAAMAIPLDQFMKRRFDDAPANIGDWQLVGGYFAFTAMLIIGCLAMMWIRLRQRRGLTE